MTVIRNQKIRLYRPNQVRIRTTGLTATRQPQRQPRLTHSTPGLSLKASMAVSTGSTRKTTSISTRTGSIHSLGTAATATNGVDTEIIINFNQSPIISGLHR